MGSGPEAEAVGERARSVRSRGRVLERPLQLPCQTWTGGQEKICEARGACVSQWRGGYCGPGRGVSESEPSGDGRTPASLGGCSTC